MNKWKTTVKCVEEFNPGKGTTKGQTYNVENGRIIYDNGNQSFNEHENLEGLNRGNVSKFAELKKRGRPRKVKA